jgi:hypothetical protein
MDGLHLAAPFPDLIWGIDTLSGYGRHRDISRYTTASFLTSWRKQFGQHRLSLSISKRISPGHLNTDRKSRKCKRALGVISRFQIAQAWPTVASFASGNPLPGWRITARGRGPIYDHLLLAHFFPDKARTAFRAVQAIWRKPFAWLKNQLAD